MKKFLTICFTILLLCGCSTKESKGSNLSISDTTSSESSIDSEDISESDSKSPLPSSNTEEQLFSDYPETTFVYVCHQWKEKEIDNRFNLPEGESDFLRDSLVFILYPLENDFARLHITSKLETEYSEWLDGKYQSLGDHIYKFSVKYASPKNYEIDGPDSYDDFITEGEEFSGYFVIKNTSLYYLKNSEDFSNYQNYPACEFYYSTKK